jgi:dTDP-4-dehydrorhamnose 3,5-epimerase
MLYVPKHFAQAFLTLKDNTEITYQVSQFYMHDYGRVIRYNDPAFNVTWPIEILVISDKDKNCPDSRF